MWQLIKQDREGQLVQQRPKFSPACFEEKV